MLLHTLIVCTIFIRLFESAKILVVMPTPSLSHQVVFRPLIYELISRGHEIVTITADPEFSNGNAPKNLTEIDVHNLSYTLWRELFDSLKENKQNDILSIMTIVFRVLSKVFEEQLKHETVQAIVNDKSVKFDLLILEECITATLIFSHIFKAPVIQMTSFGALPGTMKAIGSVTHPLLYPTHYHQRVHDLNIWEKLRELYTHIMFERMLNNQDIEDDKMLRNIFGNDVPRLEELKNNVHMLFLNVHPIWIYNQPLPPNVISIWGIHKPPKNKLNKNLQSYLDSSKNGVIYISFGTNTKTSSVSSEKLQILLKVFSRLPYDILWKWDSEELPGRSKNIKISQWLPQSDLLSHPNLKLFITQGGLQSTDEAISAGVPLIGFPMSADQEYNTEQYVYFKIGMKLNFNTFSEESFENAIYTVIKEDNYRRNIIQLRAKMHDQPQSALDRAIWWTEYVLRHGGAKHLRAPAANMSWAEYYELKLILILLVVITVIMGVILIIINYFYTMQLKLNKMKAK